MQEYIRVFCNKYRGMIFVILVFVNIGWFIHKQDYEEQKQYIPMYQSYIAEHKEEELTRLSEQLEGKLQEIEVEEEIVYLLDELYMEGNTESEKEEYQLQLQQYKKDFSELYVGVVEKKQVTDEKEYRLYEEMKETVDAHLSFEKKYDKMVSNANRLKVFSVFQNEDDFSNKNITKMVDDFKKVSTVKPSLVNEKTVYHWNDNNLGDYILLLLQFVVLLSFFEEKNKGLYGLVRASASRNRLVIHRGVILAIASVVGGVIIYGTTLLVSVSMYGAVDWSQPVQSLTRFQDCPYVITIGQYMMLSILLKALCVFGVGMMFWLFATIISNMVLSIFCMAIVFSIEYILYHNIHDLSKIAFWKYCNIFSFLDVDGNLQKYLNVAFGDRLVEIFVVNGIGVICFAIVFGTLAIICNCNYRTDMFAWKLSFWKNWKIQKNINKKKNGMFHGKSIKGSTNVWRHEGYKYFVILKCGLLLILYGSYVLYTYYPKEAVFDEKNALIYSYYEQLAGTVTAEKVEYIETEYEKAQTELAECDEKMLSCDSDEEWIYYYNLREALEPKVQATEYIVAESERLMELKQSGIKAMYVNPYGYQAVFEKSILNANEILIFPMLILTLTACGICAYENQSGTGKMLQVSVYGKGKVYAIKWIYCMLGAFLTWGIMVGSEIALARYKYDYPLKNVAIQNLTVFGDSKFKISILTGLILLYGLKLVGCICMVAVAFGISKLCRHTCTAYMVGAIVLLLPPGFVMMGADMMKNLSWFELIRGTEILKLILNG